MWAKPFQRFCGVIWLFTIFLASAEAQNIKAPPQINREEAKDLEVVKLGDPIRLTCPVLSTTHLIVEWTKDGVSIDETWPGFRLRARNLRVKSATADLSGTYRCKGITGYGSAEHEIKLVVIDPSDEQFGGHGPGRSQGNDYPSLRDRDYGIAQPTITQVFPTKKSTLKMAGGRVRFKCVATGVPRPEFKWFKDGMEVRVRDQPVGKVDLSAPGQLALTRLTPADSGSYQCRAENLLGQDTAEFQLHVEEPFGQKPEIVGSDPQNTTVSAGDQVSLQCRVNGQSPMHLKWLKRIEPHDTKAPRNATVAIEMLNGDRYQVLNVSDMVRSRPDEFLIKLTLSSARPSESGQYVCLAANNGGFTFKKAYLVVRDTDKDLMARKSQNYVYLMVIIPVTIVIVLALAAIFCLCQRGKHAERSPAETKSDAEASLMSGNRIVTQVRADKLRPEIAPVSEASRSAPGSCNSQVYNGRRYHPLPPHPTPTPSDHTYMVAPFGSDSSKCSDKSSSVSGQGYCNCVQQPYDARDAHSHQHLHKHIHYVC